MLACFDFPSTLTPYEGYAKLLLGVDQDLDSISAAPHEETSFFHRENLASC